jgi:hypothetical protein
LELAVDERNVANKYVHYPMTDKFIMFQVTWIYSKQA